MPKLIIEVYEYPTEKMNLISKDIENAYKSIGLHQTRIEHNYYNKNNQHHSISGSTHRPDNDPDLHQ